MFFKKCVQFHEQYFNIQLIFQITKEMKKTKKVVLISGCVFYLMMCAAYKDNLHKRRRRWGVRHIFRKRDTFGHCNSLVNEMLLKDTESFFNFTRLTPTQFDNLLMMVGPKIKKFSFRKPLSERDRLLITLR